MNDKDREERQESTRQDETIPEGLQLGALGAQQTTSPRYRYSMWPDIDADRVRSTLIAAEEQGVAALREALQ